MRGDLPTSTRPPAVRTRRLVVPAQFAAAGVSDLAAQVTATRWAKTPFVGIEASDHGISAAPPLPTAGFTGWGFSYGNATPGYPELLSWYVAGNRAGGIFRDASAYYFEPRGAVGLPLYLGTLSNPWDRIYVDSLRFGDATIQTTAAVLGAPTTVDYLVGTASGDLSAEIVAGTAPGGELGGTWASPTVDMIHAGKAHPLTADLTGNVTMTNATLAVLTDLNLTLVANTTYAFAFHLVVSTPSADGFKFDTTAPATLTGFMDWTAITTSGVTVSGASSADIEADQTITTFVIDTFHVKVQGKVKSTAGGTFSIRAAKNADLGADGTILEGYSWAQAL